MKRYLVTGGAGFIGSHLTEALLGRGAEVRVLDNFLTGKRENLAPFEGRIEIFEGDIRDQETCRAAADGMDSVLHQAALPSVPRSVKDPRTTNDINITGTLNMLVAARDAGVKSFVLASSSSVYGDDPGLPKREGKEGMPLSPYAISKLVGEKYCQVFSHLYNLPTVCLRYFNVFGPRQDPFSQYAAVIPNFITRILRGAHPTIYGDGEQSRDFTFVENVVEGNILASLATHLRGAVFNLACGDRITVNGLVSQINDILGTDVQPAYVEERPGDIRHSNADIAKVVRELKYAPKVTFGEGLKRTAEWYRSRA